MELVVAYNYHRALRRERVYKDPLDPLNVTDQHLLRYYRFPRQEICYLIEKLEPNLKRHTLRSHALPASTQVLVALRFYGSGTLQSVIADSSGLSQPSVSHIIGNVTNCLSQMAKTEIKMPSGALQMNKTMQDSGRVNGFPQVIGAIDGTHIPIKAPTEDEAIFVNRKHFHSLNVQAICNAHNVFLNYCVKYPGSTHDAFIWANSSIRRRFLNGEFGDAVLLGDSGYPLEPFLMTPFNNPATPSEERYNQSHMKTRVLVEQSFGILKSRFRCLHKSGGNLQYTPTKSAKITAACLLLHNYCIRRRVPIPEEILAEEAIEVFPVREAQVGRQQGRHRRTEIVNMF